MLGRARHQIWKALDWDEGGVAGKVCGGLLAFLIVVNSLAVMLETVEEYYTAYRGEFLLLERVSLTLFFIEYAFRVWVAPEGERGCGAWKARTRYIFSFSGVIDFMAIAPVFVGFDLRVLRMLRLLRLLKIESCSRAFGFLGNVFWQERFSLAAGMMLLVCLLIATATGIYFVEKDAQPEAFGSIPAAMWWAVITLTTVGYGDTYPVTTMGKIFSAIVAIFGIGMVAIPTGILASGISEYFNRGKKEEGKDGDAQASAEQLARIESRLERIEESLTRAAEGKRRE